MNNTVYKKKKKIIVSLSAHYTPHEIHPIAQALYQLLCLLKTRPVDYTKRKLRPSEDRV